MLLQAGHVVPVERETRGGIGSGKDSPGCTLSSSSLLPRFIPLTIWFCVQQQDKCSIKSLCPFNVTPATTRPLCKPMGNANANTTKKGQRRTEKRRCQFCGWLLHWARHASHCVICSAIYAAEGGWPRPDEGRHVEAWHLYVTGILNRPAKEHKLKCVCKKNSNLICTKCRLSLLSSIPKSIAHCSAKLSS